jgi:hypothetical protein
MDADFAHFLNERGHHAHVERRAPVGDTGIFDDHARAHVPTGDGEILGVLGFGVDGVGLYVASSRIGFFYGTAGLGSGHWGYAAAAFLAAAYAAVGLYVSSKTDSQIVSLLVSAAAGAALYVVGSDLLTAFVGNKGSEL